MIKTVKEWSSVAAALRELAAVKLSVVPSFRLGKLTARLQTEMQAVEEQRVAAIKRIGEPVAGSEEYNVLPARLPEFNVEMQALLAETLDLPFEPIPLKLLGDINIAPGVFSILHDLFTAE